MSSVSRPAGRTRNGMPKSDFVDSGVGCIHYGQIHTYYRTWTAETKSFVPPETGETREGDPR